MTHATLAGALIGTGVLPFAPAGAAQPPRVEPLMSVAVTDEKAKLLHCAGLAFLPDGARVAVRWHRPSHRFDVPAEAQLLVVGKDGGKSAPVVLPGGDPLGGVFAGRIAVSRAGEILTVGKGSSFLLQSVGSGPTLPPVKEVDLPGVRGLARGVWLAGPADGVFVLGSLPLDKPSYQLVTVEGALTGAKSRTRVLLGGGERWDLLPAADLHPSGRWFAAVLFQEKVPHGRLDLWELDKEPRKRSVELKVDAAAVSVAPDGKSVALGLSDGSVAFRSTADLSEQRQPVEVGRFTVAALAHHPRGPFVACGTYDRGGAANLVVVRADTGAVVRRIAADPDSVLAVCFNATGTRLAAFGGSGRVAVWDTSDLAVAK